MRRDERTVLRSRFNVAVHKEVFINYLEVVILEDGTIEYATPSHQAKVTEIIAKQRNITQREVADLCPPEFYLDYQYWLCKKSKALMVWHNFYIGSPNIAQIESLTMLMAEGLFHGERIEWEK